MENLILTLSCLPKVGKRTVSYFIENIIDNPKDEKDLLYRFIELKNINKRIAVPSIEEIKIAMQKSEKIILNSQKNNIKYIDVLNKNFPKRLNNIDNAPIMLFYKGNYNSLINNNSIAVVGSRKAQLKGLKCAYKLGNIFGEKKYSVVSGLAIGCDEQAHKGCIDAYGITVAVMPCGLDNIYPKCNESLANSILDKEGCLVSEYPIGTITYKNNFIERDRIQSALSSAVVVCEAEANSGTMHTAKFARCQNKVLACLDIEASGNKKIIEENNCIVINNLKDINKLKLEVDKYNKSLLNLGCKIYSQQLKLSLY